MGKFHKIKLASLILFWVGVIAEFFVIIGMLSQYQRFGYIDYLVEFGPEKPLWNIAEFVWQGFGHFMHIVAGYWLAKKLKKGAVFGIIIGVWETVGATALFPELLSEPFGLAVRILFAFVLWLIISGRKELVYFQYFKWRPWSWLFNK